MEEEGVQTLRRINHNSVVEIEHSNLQPPGPQSPSHQSPPAHEPHHQAHHNHHHQHGHAGQGQQGESEGCGSGGCKHKHGNKNGPRKRNVVIIIYTVLTCFSCLYLQTQHLNPFINSKSSDIMSFLCWVDVFMCLWSYYQTIVTDPAVLRVKGAARPYPIDYDKTCEKCENRWKGPRVSHCSSCGKCVYKLDHHCMWTQICIGYTNQKSFYLFCLYMSFGVLQFWWSTLQVHSVLSTQCSFFSQFDASVYLLWAITCFSAGVVGLMIVSLAVGHIVMMATNYTTLDSMKNRKGCPYPWVLNFCAANFKPDRINLWDRGEVQNLKLVFGTNIITALLPFARQVENEFVGEPMHPQLPLEDDFSTETEVKSPEEAREQYKGQRVKVNGEVIHL